MVDSSSKTAIDPASSGQPENTGTSMFGNISLWNNGPNQTAGGGQVVHEMSGLTWDSARALSVIYFTACSNPALVVANDNVHEFVWHKVNLKLFGWLMDIETADAKHLGPMLRATQKVAYEKTVMSGKRSSPQGSWSSIPLVGTYRNAGGQVHIQVVTGLLHYLRTQDSLTTLPFEFKPDLPSVYARSAYANLAMHLHREHWSTDWIPLDVVRLWPGRSRASIARNDNFLEKVVANAIREINERSDVEIEYETAIDEAGLKDIRIRFATKRKDASVMRWEYLQTQLELFPDRPSKQRALLLRETSP